MCAHKGSVSSVRLFSNTWPLALTATSLQEQVVRCLPMHMETLAGWMLADASLVQCTEVAVDHCSARVMCDVPHGLSLHVAAPLFGAWAQDAAPGCAAQRQARRSSCQSSSPRQSGSAPSSSLPASTWVDVFLELCGIHQGQRAVTIVARSASNKSGTACVRAGAECSCSGFVPGDQASARTDRCNRHAIGSSSTGD